MINWKDFLFYSKSDKIAIILLLVLIFISGIFSIYLNQFSSIDLSYYNQRDSIEQEFVEFEQNLVEAPVLEDTIVVNVNKVKKNSKNTSKKLEKGQTIDLNSATLNLLIRVPGIGNTFAERIIEYRKALGGFFKIEQLLEIKGITNKKYSLILPYLQIKKSHGMININKIPLEKLSSHPYFNEIYIDVVRKLREKGKITSIDQLAKDENFRAKDIENITPYLSF